MSDSLIAELDERVAGRQALWCAVAASIQHGVAQVAEPPTPPF